MKMFKSRRFLVWFLLMSVAGSAAVVVALIYAQEDKRYKSDTYAPLESEFEEVNPPHLSFPVEIYIWTPKSVYRAGEPIPLYIERLWLLSVGVSGSADIGVLNPTFPGQRNMRVKKLDYGFLSLCDLNFEVPGAIVEYISEYEGNYVPQKAR